VYTIRVEALARDHQAYTTACLMRGQQPPDWDEAVAAFNTRLAEPPADEAGAGDRTARGIKLRALRMP
jgi:hypothetical protein